MSEILGLPLDLVLDAPDGYGLGAGLNPNNSPVLGIVILLEGHGLTGVDVLHRPVVNWVEDPASHIDGPPGDHLGLNGPIIERVTVIIAEIRLGYHIEGHLGTQVAPLLMFVPDNDGRMSSGPRDRDLIIIQRGEFTSAGDTVDPAVDDDIGVGQLHGRHCSGHLGVKGDPSRIRTQDHNASDILARIGIAERTVGRDVEGVGEPRAVGRSEGGILHVEIHSLKGISRGEAPGGLPRRGVQPVDASTGDEDGAAHPGEDLLNTAHVNSGRPHRIGA